jgi:hypothetical protein
MPGFVLTVANQVFCSHSGQAKPKPIPPALDRVKIMGMSVVTLTTVYVVGGCGLPVAAPGSPPCATGSFTIGATRVKSLGSPIVILPPIPDSKCIPTGTPLLPTPAGQMRVQAS